MRSLDYGFHPIFRGEVRYLFQNPSLRGNTEEISYDGEFKEDYRIDGGFPVMGVVWFRCRIQIAWVKNVLYLSNDMILGNTTIQADSIE